MRIRSMIALAAMLFPAIAMADTVRMKSGELLEGKVTDAGDRLLVESGPDSFSLRWRDVDVVHKDRTPQALLTERMKSVDRADAASLYSAALWAGKAGLTAERRDLLDQVLEIDGEHEGARSGLEESKKGGKWLGGSKLLQAKGFVSHGGRWILAEEAKMLARRGAAVKQMTSDETRAEGLIKKAAAGGERVRPLAMKALDGLSPDALVRPALRMLRRGTPAERRIAAAVLGTVGDVDVIRPLVFHAIRDRDSGARSAAVKALKKIDHEDTLKPIAKALYSQVPAIRMNAAEAMGAFGGGMSVQYILKRIQSTGGMGTRNHISTLTQISYISDFDVEIAQAAQIGDPIVGVISEGVILDTRVTGVVEEYTVVERRVLYRALARATGKDFGQDLTAWAKWWVEEGREELAAK